MLQNEQMKAVSVENNLLHCRIPIITSWISLPLAQGQRSDFKQLLGQCREIGIPTQKMYGIYGPSLYTALYNKRACQGLVKDSPTFKNFSTTGAHYFPAMASGVK